MWLQFQIRFKPQRRGFHLVTKEILEQLEGLENIKVGILHLFLQHTSASLTINENADPTVRQDFESYFNDIAAEDKPYYVHNYEGPDDMPAHLKSSLIGTSITIPISKGRLGLGHWQGIYLCEHRNFSTSRMAIATIQGEVSP